MENIILLLCFCMLLSAVGSLIQNRRLDRMMDSIEYLDYKIQREFENHLKLRHRFDHEEFIDTVSKASRLHVDSDAKGE